MRALLHDIVLPRTDAGVAFQVVFVLVVLAFALRRTWPSRDLRDEAGSDGVGAFYGAIGRRVHEQGEPLDDSDTVQGALDDAGLDPGPGVGAPLEPGIMTPAASRSVTPAAIASG